MPSTLPLTHQELENRLLKWISSAYVPRYPFFETNVVRTPTFSSPSPSSSLASSLLSTSFTTSPESSTASLRDLPRWFNDIEIAGNDCDIPVEQYPDVAIYFLRGDLQEVMKKRKEVYLREAKRRFWDWRDFREDLTRIVVLVSPQVSSLAHDAMEHLRRAHPYVASSVKVGLIIGGTAVLLPALGLMAWKRFYQPQAAQGANRALASPQ
ncbi:hypothetical protein CVT24_008871 [Panaeolus cyanescens]|uniref:Uncharacterized protein n=1 Tax=Panaeolus cyanescens TaxID=181874 RepID=A0A409VAX5_9AGAR|nr:hypothetical protein CVT24_008871 [Panaeolus cyanescens]